MTFEETCAKGYHPATVKRIEQLLYVSEYKRRQAPPGVKITRAISAATGAIRSPMRSGTRAMFEAIFNPPLEGGSKNAKHFSGRGEQPARYPSPKFASLRYANCRPSLKGRVE